MPALAMVTVCCSMTCRQGTAPASVPCHSIWKYNGEVLMALQHMVLHALDRRVGHSVSPACAKVCSTLQHAAAGLDCMAWAVSFEAT